MESNELKNIQDRADNKMMNIDDRRYFIDNFKTFYYELNAKPDSTTQVFQEDVVIKLDDIFDLVDRISDKIKNHYEDDGYSICIDIKMSKGRNISFSNWAEFESHKWTESNIIKSITIKMDFYLKLPKYTYPQRHLLIVKLATKMNPSDVLSVLFSGKIEDIDEINLNDSTVLVRVDFINQNISDELINIISEWVKGLEKTKLKKSKIILFFRKYRKYIAYYINYLFIYLFVFIGMLQFNNMLSHFTNDNNTIIKYFDFVVIWIVGCFTFLKICNHVARRIFGRLESYGFACTFEITKGDKKYIREIEEDNRKAEKHIFFNLFISFILNIICGIIVGVLMNGGAIL